MKIEILYEDNCILVCHKPAGIATQTARVGEADMVSELKNYLASKDKHRQIYLGLVHRLDQPVEGLLVFGKTKKATAVLTDQLKGGILNKDYKAVVCNARKDPENAVTLKRELEDYMRKNADNRAIIREASESGIEKYQRAVLHYQMAPIKTAGYWEEKNGKTLSFRAYLANIQIETGRFHQIRAQMANAGFPILGDWKYGNEISIALGKELKVHHVLLCADRIRFRHPESQEWKEFRIAPGEEFYEKGVARED